MRALLLWLLVPALAFAQIVPRNEFIEKAQSQVDDGDFEDAVKTVKEGIAAADTDDQLAELYRLAGLAYLYLGKESDARDAFEQLLQARPDYELPAAAPKKIRALYARIKEDIGKRRVRPVTLTLTPVSETTGNEAVDVQARIEDMALGAKARVFYRRAGVENFSSVDFVRDRNDRTQFTAGIPAFALPTEERAWEVEYYVEVSNAASRRLAGKGDAFNPLRFTVLAKQTDGAAAEAVPAYKSPWLWIGVGLGVAAVTTGVVLLATTQQTGTLPVRIQITGEP